MAVNSRKTEKKNKDKISLINYFKKSLNSGKRLTIEELQLYVKKRKLDVDPKFVSQIRKKVLSTALFTPVKPAKAFQTLTIPKLGLCSMDFAYYKKEWAWHNKGYVGFLMINSISPKKRWAVPMKSRNTKSFEKSIEEVCLGNIFPAINTILSDRETTIFSKNFQKEMKKKYKIKFQFIQRFNKAWSSEIAIRYTKEQLSISLISKGGKKWIDFLPEVIASHNRKKIAGTSFSPNQINDSNFREFSNQLQDVEDATVYFNTNSIDQRSILSDKWKEQIFQYKIDDKVLVTKYSLKGRKAFSKASVEGTFESAPYYIHEIKLRQSGKDALVRGKCCMLITTFTILKTFKFLFFQYTK